MWVYIESDFLRDYGINLIEEFPHMSWRRFTTLLRGLSPYGAVATNYQRIKKEFEERQAKEENKPSNAVNSFWSTIASLKEIRNED